MARASIPRFARNMYLQQVLVMFDGPQVVLMKSDRGFPSIGIALDDYGSDEHSMHFAEVSERDLDRYLQEKFDLRYLFKSAAKRRYIADWYDLDEKGWVPVKRADDITEEEFFPNHGFWARHHTEDLLNVALVPASVARFAIDGSWDASDFSRFYGKFADLYAFLAITSEKAIANLSPDMLDFVKSTIRSLGWRGGGSYVGFYDSIFSKVHAFSPLKVRRISYASPGMIDLKGAEEPLADVSRVVDHFSAQGSDLKASYSVVDRILAHEKLKTARVGARFQSEESERLVRFHCGNILLNLGINDPGLLLLVCSEDLVVFSKVTLSFFRRAKELHAFHSEGRVDAKGFIADS